MTRHKIGSPPKRENKSNTNVFRMFSEASFKDAADLVKPTQVMDAYLMSIARGKKISTEKVIEVLSSCQTPYNELDSLYQDIKELHRTHQRKQKRELAVGKNDEGQKKRRY